MKLLFSINKLILLASIIFLHANVFSQAGGTTCPNMEPICTINGVNFQANAGGPNVIVSEPGNNYDCLGTSPNPSWFYLEIATAGDIIMRLTAATDIDFILWGPYANLATAQATCGNHQNVVPDVNCDFFGSCDSQGCSYSTSNTETPGIPNAQVGEVYVLLITNYANNVQDITLTQIGGTGSTNCDIVFPCNITNFTANIGACNAGTYDISGFIDYISQPLTGDLIIEDCFGTQHVVGTAPFPTSSVLNYNITGLTADGWACDLHAYFTDDPGCSAVLNYTAPPPCTPSTCSFTSIDANITACDPNTNSFDVTGSVEFVDPPVSGTLTISDCNGNSQVFNPPFISPINYSILGINSDGTTNCSVTATFSADPACTIDVGPYDNPEPCVCDANIGTFTTQLNGNANGSNPWTLCFGDELDLIGNSDFVPSEDFSVAGATYDPGVWLLVYDCPPTVLEPNDILNDPCLLGVASSADQAWTIINSAGSGVTRYFVPVSMYSMVDGIYAISINSGVWCYDLGPVYPVTFLPEITAPFTQNCQTGTATVTINGGDPAVNGSQFTGSNLLPATASFSNATANNGGTITISGLQDGDNWSFDIADVNGCPISVSGLFTATEDPSFNYANTTYCQDDADPIANITGATGGTFTSSAGLVINAATGLVDLSASTAGTYTITYTTPDPICFDQATFDITINAVPNITTPANVSVCIQYILPAITGTNLTGNEAYYTGPGASGTQLNPGDVINTMGTNTIYIYDATGTVPNCTDETTFNVTIDLQEDPSFNYANDTYCQDGVDPTANITGTTGGTFTSSAGLVINAATGLVDLSASTAGTYTITYTTPDPVCFDQATFDITINVVPIITTPANVSVCIQYILPAIAGTNLTGNEAYYTGPGASGTQLNPGDIINTVGTNTIYIYDETGTVPNCIDETSFNVTIDPLEDPSFNYTNDNYCQDGVDPTANITGATGGTFTSSAGLVINAATGLVDLSASTAGTYTITYTTPDPVCFDQATFDITINAVPNITTPANVIECTQYVLPAIVGTNLTGNEAYYTGSGASGMQMNPGDVLNTFGTTTIYIYDATGTVPNCTDETSFNVTIVPELQSITCPGPLTAICNISEQPPYANYNAFIAAGGSVTIDPLGNVDPSTFNLVSEVSDGNTCPEVITRTYEVADECGTVRSCQQTITINDLINPTGSAPANITIALDTPIPAPDASLITNEADNCGVPTVQWTGDVSDGGYCPEIITRTYRIEDACGNFINVNHTITIGDGFPTAEFIALPNSLTTLDTEVDFNNISSNAASYTWSFGDGTGSNSANPSHTFPNIESGSYVVQLIATSPLGCTDTAYQTIRIIEEEIFYVPNTFTPDGDSYNETFKAIFSSGYDPYNFTMLIFNRWGEIIWESHDWSVGWNGTYGDKIVPDGIYTWKIEVKTTINDERRMFTGHVNVIR